MHHAEHLTTTMQQCIVLHTSVSSRPCLCPTTRWTKLVNLCNLQVIGNQKQSYPTYINSIPAQSLTRLTSCFGFKLSLPNLCNVMQLHFLQTLPHHLVTAIHLLSICTVEVVGTSQQLVHLFSKVWLPCTAMLLVSNLLVIFPDIALHHDSYSIFISDHLSIHEPCSNCWRIE